MPDATPLVHAKAEVYLYKDVRSSILENRIKKMRKAKGWTQAELAKAVGVTQAKKLFLSSLPFLAARLDISYE